MATDTFTSDMLAVEAEVRRLVEDGRILHFVTDGRGHGRVTVYRPRAPFQQYVSWRWATVRTDCTPVGGRTGAMVWSGQYCETEAAAEYDLWHRGETI